MQAQLICDDARNVLNILPKQSVDCIITSPPYFNQRDYHTGIWIGGSPDCDHVKRKVRNDLQNKKEGLFNGWKDGAPHHNHILYKDTCKRCGAIRIDSQIGIEDSLNHYLENLIDVFNGARRVLKDTGTMFVVVGDNYYYKNEAKENSYTDYNNHMSLQYPEQCLMLVPYMLAAKLIQNHWIIRQLIVWHKPNTLPEPPHKRFTIDFEIIIFATKTTQYFFNEENAKELTSDGKNQRRMRAVWSIPNNIKKGYHTATMPITIAEKCIAVGCPPEGTVLDPFCGSGTTLIAAINKQCNAIGIDLSEKYIRIAENRIKEETGIDPVVYIQEENKRYTLHKICAYDNET